MYAPIHLPAPTPGAPSQPWEPESNSATECELLGCQNTLSATYHFKLNTQPVEPQSNPNGDKKSWPVSSLVSACRCAQNEFPFANIRLIFSSILTSGSQIGTSVSTSRCQIHGTENKSWWFTHKTEHARYKSLQIFFLVKNRPKNSVFLRTNSVTRVFESFPYQTRSWQSLTNKISGWKNITKFSWSYKEWLMWLVLAAAHF